MSLSEDKIKQFLMVCLFGDKYKTVLNDEEKIGLAINRAYRDFCRTIRDGKEWNANIELDVPKGEEKKEYYDISNSRGRASKLIKEAIESNQFNDYNTWHMKLCDKLSNQEGAIGYTYGQAQKWVNMTMKYLLILRYKPVEDIIGLLHIPLDKIILDKAVDKKLITRKLLKEINRKDPTKGVPAEFSWSRINSYAKYNEIQTVIQNKIKEKEGIKKPILWEFDAWNESSNKE